MANISDFIGKYGSAQADAKAYADKVSMETQKPYTITESESQQFLNHYNKRVNSPTNEDAGIMRKGAGKLVGVGADLLATQEQKGTLNLSNEFISASEAAKGLLDASGNLKKPLDMVMDLGKAAVSQVGLYYQQQTELMAQMNQEAGLVGTYSEDVREELTKANPELMRFGIGFQELADAASNLVSDSGRFITLNSKSWTEAGIAAKAYVGSLAELVQMYPEFEKIGYGASDVAKQIEIAGSKSIGLGLQAQKVSKELSTNLNRLNEFGFKNGVQGMADMVRKSIEFRMNMQSVYTIADKVFDPEGAVDLAANLQAIGGAIGDFNDPLKLMYMATNNVEGLQDALVGVAGSLATYNQEQGRFEITGANLRKAKELAKSLGIDYKELANTAIASAERSSAATAMMASGLQLKDDEKEFLTNISQMKGGQMTIELNSDRIKEALGVGKDTKEIALENLTQAQANTLLKYQEELKEKTPEDIVKGQATNIENIMRDVSYMAALLRTEAGQTGERLAKEIGFDPKKMALTMNEIATTKGPEIKGSLTQFLGENDTKKEKEKTKTETTGTTNTLRVEHTIKDSSVVMDYTKRTWNDYFGSLDPTQYTAPTDASLPK